MALSDVLSKVEGWPRLSALETLDNLVEGVFAHFGDTFDVNYWLMLLMGENAWCPFAGPAGPSQQWKCMRHEYLRRPDCPCSEGQRKTQQRWELPQKISITWGSFRA